MIRSAKKHGFRGFAAKLSDEQASQVSKITGVISVFPNSKRKLHTTHSWDFTSDILLGNGAKVIGESLSLFEMNTSSRIISASQAFAGYFTPYQSNYCLENSLNKTKTKGKVLVCRNVKSSTNSKVKKRKIV
ncbi:hypothetical protein RYX36_019461 [Vicia faba]